MRAEARWGALLAASCILAGCGVDATARAAVGSPAPEYRAVTLDGDPFELAQLEGEVVLLNLWATWCPPCRYEMPDLQALHEELYDEGLRVVGVSLDSDAAERAVRDFLAELGIDFLVVRDPADRASTVFGAYGVPMSLLIDREGLVVWRHLGPVTARDPGLRAALGEAL